MKYPSLALILFGKPKRKPSVLKRLKRKVNRESKHKIPRDVKIKLSYGRVPQGGHSILYLRNGKVKKVEIRLSQTAKRSRLLKDRILTHELREVAYTCNGLGKREAHKRALRLENRDWNQLLREAKMKP